MSTEGRIDDDMRGEGGSGSRADGEAEVNGPAVDGDRSESERIRRGIELIEQAPAEALYRKLLESLTRAGADADLRKIDDVSKRIVFAYKLAVELGGKLGLLSEEDLALRRRLAAMLFGEGSLPIDEDVLGPQGNGVPTAGGQASADSARPG